MKLTNDQLRQNAASLIAFADGKPIQWLSAVTQEWRDCSSDEIPDVIRCIFRPKPEAKTRPWSKPSDVPVGIVYLRSAGFDEGFSLLLSAGVRGVQLPTYTHENVVIEWDRLSAMEYSTDRKTWHPCTVTE